MHKLIAFLLIIIAALQYRLWLGDGGIREYRETAQRIHELQQEGEQRKVRNAAVAADVQDLQHGADAIEERARRELGMIKPGETYVQVFDSAPPLAVTAPPLTTPPPTARKRPSKPVKPGLQAKTAGKTAPLAPKPAKAVKPKVAGAKPKTNPR